MRFSESNLSRNPFITSKEIVELGNHFAMINASRGEVIDTKTHQPKEVINMMIVNYAEANFPRIYTKTSNPYNDRYANHFSISNEPQENLELYEDEKYSTAGNNAILIRDAGDDKWQAVTGILLPGMVQTPELTTGDSIEDGDFIPVTTETGKRRKNG